MTRKILKLFLCFAVMAVPSFASALTINKIVVEGNRRVETETVKAFLSLPMGSAISRGDLDEAFRRTFDTGLFKDIDMTLKAGVLKVAVEENPSVSEVKVSGNDKIDDKKILNELKLKTRSIYKESDAQADVRRILTLYQRSGRFNVSVSPEVKELEDGRVRVTYLIDEGKRARVSQISFINNRSYDEAELESIINTRESRWYRFFSGSDNYDPDRLEFDKELLRRHYVANGFADFRVLSADAEFDNVNEAFNIIFNLDEGPYYRFGKVDVESAIPDIKYDEIADSIKTKSGNEFNSTRIEDTVSELTEYLGDKGFAFVKINPVFSKNPDKGIMNLKYDISEGPRVYIDKINIKGNTRTTDEVIRREFRLVEGDPFNSSKLKRSKQRVEGLGYFSKVDIANKPTQHPDKVDVDVTVEEQSTGELTLGAGFSSADGALADVGITERNLLGRGQYLKVNTTLAASRQEIDLAFTEPYFLDTNFAAGFDIFKVKTDGNTSTSNLAYDSDSIGFTLRGSYPLTEYLNHNLRYTYSDTEISNPDVNASTFVKQQVGQRVTSSVGHSFVYNSLDNQFLPKKGFHVVLSQDLAGLGGDVDYLKHEAKASYFTTVNDDYSDVVFRLTGKAGNIEALNDDKVRINDRFFIGGTVLRGFDNQGIGPRDKASNDPLGGNTYYAATAEVMFPLGLPEELQIKGAAFVDAGSLYDVDDNDPSLQIQDDESIRSSAGVGVFWRSPVGPIRIDFAKTLSEEEYDEDESIRFSFGTRF